MAKTLQQILGYENLCGIISDPKAAIPDDILPPSFFNFAGSVKTEGNTGKYTKVDGTRQVARLVQYGSASVRRKLKGVSEKPIVLMHSHEHIMHDVNTLNALRAMDSPALQERGVQEIDRQTVAFRKYFDMLRLNAVFSILRYGAIYFDGDGQLLPSSTGAVTTVDFAVDAANQGQLNWDGDGAIIDASWATAGTDIIGHMKELKRAARLTTGYPLAWAFYGDKILEYLLTNTLVKEYLNRNPAMQQSLIAGEIPDGLFNLKWRPIGEAFFQDQDGTDQVWFGDDHIVFTPEPSPEWFEWVEGSYQIPTNLGGVYSGGLDAANAFSKVYGMFSFASVESDPAGIKHNCGDTFLPTLKVPRAIWIADVTP